MPLAAKAVLLLAGLIGAILFVQPNHPENRAEALPVVPRGPRILYPPGRYPALLLPNGQKRAVRSLLNLGRPMRFGGYVWNDQGIPDGPAWIRIDLARQTLSLFRAGHEIGSAVILYGTDHKPTPSGIFTVLERARTHRSTLYDAPMPFMLRLTGDGVAIHASNVRAGSATHGCIGVPIGFARLLFAQIKRGDLVAILPANSISSEASS